MCFWWPPYNSNNTNVTQRHCRTAVFRERQTIQAQLPERKRQAESIVLDECFKIQAKLPLRNHGLRCERHTSQARWKTRKRTTETVVFVDDGFETKTKLELRKKQYTAQHVLWMPHNSSNTNVTQNTTARLFFVDVKQFKHNYRNGRDRPKLLLLFWWAFKSSS